MRACSICQEVKEFKKFPKDASKAEGRSYVCADCYRAKRKEIYARQRQDHNWNLKRALKTSKTRAAANNKEHTLTLEQLIRLYPLNNKCPALGIELSWEGHRDSSPSIDRIDSNEGYSEDNCCIISTRANRIKNNATLEELQALVAFLGGL